MGTTTDEGRRAKLTRAYREQRDELQTLRALHEVLADLLDASRERADESLLMGRLEKALAVTCAALNAQTGAVLVCEPDRALVFVAVHGVDSQTLLWTRIERTLGVAGWVVQKGKPAIVNNAAMDGRFFAGVDSETGFRTRSLLASPILTGSGTLLGVVEVVNKKNGKLFSGTDLRSLGLVAHAVGLVLEPLAQSANGLDTGRMAAASRRPVP